MADHNDPSDTPVTHDPPVSNDTPVSHDPPVSGDTPIPQDPTPTPTPDDAPYSLADETSSLQEEFGVDHPVSELVSEFVELLDDVELDDDPEIDEVLEMLAETYDLEALTHESLREILARLRDQD